MAGNKDDLPSVATFGQWRAKMARRGVPQAWIDKFLGSGINGRSRGQIDIDLREGYTWGQINPVQYTILGALQSEGWGTILENKEIVVIRRDGARFPLLLDYMMACDYSDLPGPLANDLIAAMKAGGYCE